MTYKEVISHLRNEIVNATGTLAALPPKAAEISGLNHHINALDLAIKAVKKQIPDKPHPIKIVVDRLEIGNARWGKGTIVYRCPVCETYMTMLHDYCYKCGQRIDWSGAGDQTKGECEQE